jgi:hypothetical protein
MGLLPTGRNIITALYGAYRLANYDTNGLKYFNVSSKGFWHSFTAAGIIAPFYLILLTLRFSGMSEVSSARFFAIEIIAYIIVWVAFPIIISSLVQIIKREKKYISFIVAYNWSAVFQNTLFLPIEILALAGFLQANTANFLGLIAIALVIGYIWFITRSALEISGILASGIVIIDILTSILINTVAFDLLKLGTS